MTVTSIRSKPGSIGISAVEAAWLTEVPAKTINATIDRGELARSSRTRGLRPSDLLYLILRKEIGGALSADAKRELYEKVSDLRLALGEPSSAHLPRSADVAIPLAGGALRVEIKPAWLRLAKRWGALRAARNEVVEDPAIRSGEPVIRGTRIPVYLIGDLLAQGADVKEIMEDYPALDATKIRAALAYIETRPKRGRPRDRDSMNEVPR